MADQVDTNSESPRRPLTRHEANAAQWNAMRPYLILLLVVAFLSLTGYWLYARNSYQHELSDKVDQAQSLPLCSTIDPSQYPQGQKIACRNDSTAGITAHIKAISIGIAVVIFLLRLRWFIRLLRRI
jgi:uncharacterized membrane protein